MDSIFFILSKVVWAFLSPSNLIIFLFAFGTLLVLLNRARLAKIILLPTSIIALAMVAYPFSHFLMAPLESRFAQPENLPAEIDGIIVLGGGEDLQTSLSWGRPELGLGGDRYMGAKELATHYPNAPVIFTGGSGSVQLQESAGEGSVARSLLIRLGIPENRLIIESQSRNTYENFKLVKPMLPKPNGTYLLVTSAFHMPRSVGIARKQGVNVMAYPVDYRTSLPEMRNLDFNYYDHLDALEPAWKEWIGLSVYYLTNKTSDWFPAPVTTQQNLKDTQP